MGEFDSWPAWVGACFGCVCGTCLGIIFVTCTVTFTALAIQYGVTYQGDTTYQPVESIVQTGNDTYEASMQCLADVLQNVTTHCGLYTILVPCTKFPDKTRYTEITFDCGVGGALNGNQSAFIDYLYQHQGGKQTGPEDKTKQALFSTFLTLALVCGFTPVVIIIAGLLAAILVLQAPCDHFIE
jgi:hypothetical protein